MYNKPCDWLSEECELNSFDLSGFRTVFLIFLSVAKIKPLKLYSRNLPDELFLRRRKMKGAVW
jgi:hypothetical protein